MIWSFVLAAIGIFGLYIAGKQIWWGWAVGIGVQALWVIFALATQQYGFIFSAIAYGWVYGNNAHKWREEGKSKSEGGECCV